MPPEWFIRDGSKLSGPMTSTQLKRLAAEGKISTKTEVASCAAGPWRYAEGIKGLFPQSDLRPTPAQPKEDTRVRISFIDAVAKICRAISQKDFYIASDLSGPQLKKVCEAYGIAAQADLIALLDNSSFRTGTCGIAVCRDGIRWRNFLVDTTRNYLSWDEFKTIKPALTKEKHLDLGNAMIIDVSDTRFPILELIDFVSMLQDPTAAPRLLKGFSFGESQGPLRQPQKLRFAYKEAIGATVFGLALCCIAIGLLARVLWPNVTVVERVVEKVVKADSTSSQAINDPVSKPDPPRKETDTERTRRKLVGRWVGTWQYIQRRGTIRITIVEDSDSPVFRITGSDVTGSDRPFSEGTMKVGPNRIAFEPRHFYRFWVDMDETGELLEGSFWGVGKIFLEREY